MYHEALELKDLIGRTVISVYINSDKDLLRFNFTDGSLFLSATGDCCSTSWYEHISGLDWLIGSPIVSAEEIEMPNAKGNEYELVQCYGYKLKTDKGIFEIEMRNESNGYYGGSMEIHEKALDTYHNERELPKLKPLIEDF